MIEKDIDLTDQSTVLSIPERSHSSVCELQESDRVRWTDFLAEHPEANLYHTFAWRDVLQKVFGHRPLYLFSELDGKITGVLPLWLVRFPLLGAKLISIPYDIGSGGVLAIGETSERVLVEHAMTLARDMGVNFLELRCGSPRQVLADLDLQRSEPVLISEMELDDEAQVLDRVSKDHRKSIRKAERRGVTVREADSLDDYREFYSIIVKVFRGFGTPPYGSNYFPAVWQRLYASGGVKLLLAHVDERCVGGLLLYCWGKNLVSKFAACLPEAVPLRAYPALYWRAIQLGLELGYSSLSWGTSSRDQTGLIEFKEGWGAYSHPAVCYSLPVRKNVPAIEKYYDAEGMVRRLWKMQPLWTTQVIGGLLNRWFC